MKRFFSKVPLIQELKHRGLLSQSTNESTFEKGNLPVYLGADPSGDSLHLGNLMPLMVLLHFYLRGHQVFPLIGGATGIVGDPSGRKSERAEMEAAQRQQNVEKIKSQMQQILNNSEAVARQNKRQVNEKLNYTLVNNNDWWANVNMLSFLGTFGRHFRINAMIARESIKQRLKSEAGLGYNEFSYQILQAYDFFHLYSKSKCLGQIGGHDQWGNIVSGVDLINRLRSKDDPEPFGLTVPLLLTPSGEKFGKSVGNAAIFLSSERTSPYHMFQHLIQSPDEAVEKYLKLFTFIPINEITELMASHAVQPEKRLAQRRLAFEVTSLVHGPELTKTAEIVTSVMFGGDQSSSEDEIFNAFKSQNLVYSYKDVVGKPWKQVLSDITQKSKSECQRLIKQKSVYTGIGRNPVSSNFVEKDNLCANNMLLIRVGKSEYYVVDSS